MNGPEAVFWAACHDGILLAQHCVQCGNWQYPPAPCCGFCLGPVVFAQSSGHGKIYSYSTVHRPQDAQFDAPYTVAIVAMDEGWYMLSVLVDFKSVSGDLIDRPVEVAFRKVGGKDHLPCFAPAVVATEEEAPRSRGARQ